MRSEPANDSDTPRHQIVCPHEQPSQTSSRSLPLLENEWNPSGTSKQCRVKTFVETIYTIHRNSRHCDTRVQCQNPGLLLIESFGGKLRLLFHLDLVARHQHREKCNSFSLEELSSWACSDTCAKRHKRVTRPVVEEPGGFECVRILPISS